jgi:hypothetical protein
MSNILTNPNKYLVNVPELQNVVTFATGSSNNYSVNQILAAIDTNAHLVKTNTLQSFNTNTINVRNNLNLSNSYISYNGTSLLNSQGINTTGNLLFNVNQVEQARFTSAGYMGLGTIAPVAKLDVVGDAVVRTGNLYVSTSGAGAGVGNVSADGTMYAQAFLTPSDPSLKTDVQPLVAPERLPVPVEFTWIHTGIRDIGFLADDVAAVSPYCVSIDTTCGKQHVNYAKLVTLCMAEIRALRERVTALEAPLGTPMGAPTPTEVQIPEPGV